MFLKFCLCYNIYVTWQIEPLVKKMEILDMWGNNLSSKQSEVVSHCPHHNKSKLKTLASNNAFGGDTFYLPAHCMQDINVSLIKVVLTKFWKVLSRINVTWQKVVYVFFCDEWQLLLSCWYQNLQCRKFLNFEFVLNTA